jgi:type VI secretion system protein ImpB
MAESTQHKLDRIRPPRVQITYDVEIGGAIQKKELPFVVGILADLSGKPENPLPPLKERKFVEIDRDNFNDVLASIQPRVVASVDNHLTKDGGKTNVELKFKSMDDFTPAQLVLQVDALKKLFESRQKLNDLLAKLDGNDALDGMLQQAGGNPDQIKQLKSSNDKGETNA